MSKYRTTVNSLATPLYSNISSVPTNSVGGSVIKNTDITGDLLRTACNGFASKMGNYVRYGTKYYTNGLPEGFAVFTDYDINEVKAIIEAETGREIEIQSHFVDTPEADYWGQDHAQRNWGWRESDGVLQDPPITGAYNTSVKLESSEILADGRLKMIVAYTDEDYANLTKAFYEELDLNQKELYYHVTYTFTDTASMDARYWFYDPDSGIYPQLDLPEDASLESPYLPIVPIRLDNQNMASDSRKETELYKTSKRLLDKISLDFTGLADQIAENPGIDGDPNNDQDNGIDHVFVIFGIDIRTTRPVSNRYLFRYFDDLANRTYKTIDIKDPSYYIRLQFDDITSKNVTGSIGDVGKVTKIFSDEDLTIRYQQNESSYREVKVTNFLHRNYIYETHSVDTSLSESADKDNDNFIIPLDYRLAEAEKSLQLREELYQEAAKLIFNAYDRQKLKWYERSWFKGLLVVASFILFVWSAGTSVAFIGGLISAYGLTTAIIISALYVALAYVAGLAFEILAEELGGIWAGIIVIAGMILARNYTAGFFKMPDNYPADQLLTLSNGINTAAASAIQAGVKDALSSMQLDIYDEMKALENEFQILEDELKNLYEELNMTTYLDPMLFTGANMFISVNESPDDFYNRTIHAGNIGTASLAVPSEFIDNRLSLPEPEYSMIEES